MKKTKTKTKTTNQPKNSKPTKAKYMKGKRTRTKVSTGETGSQTWMRCLFPRRFLTHYLSSQSNKLNPALVPGIDRVTQYMPLATNAA